MKKTYCFSLLLALLFLCTNIFSQSILYSYRQPDLSIGKRLFISGNPLLEYNATDSKNSVFNFDLEGLFNYWKFTPKISTAGYADAKINFSTTKVNDTSVSSNSEYADVYGGMNYYFHPNKIYGTAAIGGSYLKKKTGDVSSDAYSPFYLWLGAGYGRLINAERVFIASDFQNNLKKLGITKENLSDAGLLKLTNLLDKRANGDFDAKFKDNAEVEFFAELENLLKGEGKLENCMDARSALKLYQVLTDPSYIYYPRYNGYQLQADLQIQLYSGTSGVKSTEHYLSVSGVYGKSLSYKTQFVGSAFFSMSLNDAATGLWKETFFPYINFIPDRTALDFFTQNDGLGLFGGHYTPAKTTYFGIRGDIFHSISSFAGARGYAQFLYAKPKDIDATNWIEIGARLDYNILARLVAYGQAQFVKQSKVDAAYEFKVGFTYFVF